jgi:hypothetical protein
MEENKHSKGPWTVIQGVVIAADGFSLDTGNRTRQEKLANAELICRAPQMDAQIQSLEQDNARLREALEGLVSLGRKDLSNPKYDAYFQTATEALNQK